jgi:hypothetical protein
MRAWLAALAVALPLAAARGSELAFVYVAPNVGGASGGHAALVVDGTAYNLQRYEDGLLRLERESFAQFELRYARLQNRPLELARVAVSAETAERVQRAFSRWYVRQKLALARRESLREDQAWLEALAGETDLAPRLRAAGLFAPALAGDSLARELAHELDARLGRDAAAQLAGEAETRGARVSLADGEAGLESLREALALREAARVLHEGLALDPEAVAALPAELDTPLTPAERAGLAQLSQRLAASAAELVESRRPDRGMALLLTLARQQAAERSLRSGHLLALDAFPEQESAPAGDSHAVERGAFAARTFARARAAVLAAARSDESSLNLLEEAASAAARSGRSDGVMLSDLGVRQLPARARRIALPRLAGDAHAALAAARRRRSDFEASLRAQDGYDLLRRNCVTELSRAFWNAFGSADEVVRALGGVPPEPDEPLGFVPLAFFERASRRLPIARVERVASERERGLAALAHESPSLWARLRESSALTSSLYAPHLDDGAFLLFSDDVFWRRPVYGAANLGYALGYAGYGLTAAPFDGGARLRAGLVGALFSLPELGFVTLRRGTYDWVDPDESVRGEAQQQLELGAVGGGGGGPLGLELDALAGEDLRVDGE